MPTPGFEPINSSHSDAVEIDVIDKDKVATLIRQLAPEKATIALEIINSFKSLLGLLGKL